jgi:hypothetical protein
MVGRHKNNTGFGTRCFNSRFYGIENRDFSIHHPIAALAGRYACHNACAVADHFLGVEMAFFPGNALYQYRDIISYQDAHFLLPVES